MMDIRPIRTQADYQAALEEIERLFDAPENSPEAARLDVLATLADAYEARQFPIPAPDPVTALEYYMESRGLTRRDLERALGSRARVSEILSRKRALSLEMIRRLNQMYSLSAELLIQPYETAKRRGSTPSIS